MDFDYSLIDKQQKDIIASNNKIILVIAARQTGKTNIIKEKMKDNKSLVIVPLEGLKRAYGRNENIVTVNQIFGISGRGRKYFDEDTTVFIEELDLMKLTKQQIKDLLKQPFKQLYIIGTPRSLKSKVKLDNSLGYLQFKFEFESDLLQLYYDSQDNTYWNKYILSFYNIPTDFKKYFNEDEFENEFLPLY
jgi:hypothetical protein